MSETIHVPCQRCGAEITFEVESWADPPERAWCGEECYEKRSAEPTPSQTARC